MRLAEIIDRRREVDKLSRIRFALSDGKIIDIVFDPESPEETIAVIERGGVSLG